LTQLHFYIETDILKNLVCNLVDGGKISNPWYMSFVNIKYHNLCINADAKITSLSPL